MYSETLQSWWTLLLFRFCLNGVFMAVGGIRSTLWTHAEAAVACEL